MVIVCVSVLVSIFMWALASKLYAFIKTLPSVSTATSSCLPSCLPSAALLVLLTTHCSVASSLLPPSQAASAHSLPVSSSFVSLRFTCMCFIPPFISYCNLCINHSSSTSSSTISLSSSSLLSTLLRVGVKLRLYFPFLVLYCQCIVAFNPVKMLWEYCINLSLSLLL